MHKCNKYGVFIYWSDEDGLFIPEVPELPGCMAHGNSQDDALKNAQDVMELWLEPVHEFGDPIPEPRGQQLTPETKPESPPARYAFQQSLLPQLDAELFQLRPPRATPLQVFQLFLQRHICTQHR